MTAIYVLTCKLSVHKCNKLFITVKTNFIFNVNISLILFVAIHSLTCTEVLSFRDSKRELEIKVGCCINLLLSQFLLDVLFHLIIGIGGIINGLVGFFLVRNVLIRDR